MDLVRRKADGQPFAAKYFDDPGQLSSGDFMNEAQFLINVRNVCIVTGVGIYLPKSEGEPAILYMEFLEGGSLLI